MDNLVVCVIFFDKAMKEMDGKGWCINFSNASAIQRFETLGDAQLYITDNSWYFMPAML